MLGKPALAAGMVAAVPARTPAQGAAGRPAGRAAPAASGEAVQQVLAAARAIDSAWMRGDRAALDRLLADEFADTDASGEVTLKPALLPRVGPAIAGFSFSPSQDDVRVAVLGDAAVLTARKTFRMQLGDQVAFRPQRVTDVFVRQDGRWRMAASHQSDFLPPRVAVAVNPAVYDAYVGHYVLGPADTVTVTREAGKLMAQPAGRSKVELRPLSATEFFIEGFPGTFTFVRDASGAVTGQVMRYYGLEQRWRRVR
jgi:hypothetical protein